MEGYNNLQRSVERLMQFLTVSRIVVVKMRNRGQKSIDGRKVFDIEVEAVVLLKLIIYCEA